MDSGCPKHVVLGSPEEMLSCCAQEDRDDTPLVRERKIKK